ncbi:unnamed protein product [Parascedosporium putredinis]|uniref:Uncharacterized protein n=1 Tax=Parascedosporium putredinis TaxID=1442378 RepID=A0A9P1H0M0_9PEZI|nr:unnamed protein product [Parascedosporium putredinis]CAI7992254.1 unnamed protein product [Parascedosporium putredinis]
MFKVPCAYSGSAKNPTPILSIFSNLKPGSMGAPSPDTPEELQCHQCTESFSQDQFHHLGLGKQFEEFQNKTFVKAAAQTQRNL